MRLLTDKSRLAEYNLKDCELVSRIFEHTALLDFALARSAMTGLNVDRLGGSVASFDNLYLPRLHFRLQLDHGLRMDLADARFTHFQYFPNLS